jgi:predicted transcriptional regulator
MSMTDQQAALRSLSRKELLELLLTQSQEIEELRSQLEHYQWILQKQERELAKSDEVVEAALLLNRVYQAAQSAGQPYMKTLQEYQRRRMSDQIYEGGDDPWSA